MTKKTATKKDAAQTSDEAGATPPFDARCVTGTSWGRSRLMAQGNCANGLGRDENFEFVNLPQEEENMAIVKKPPESRQPLAAARTARKRTAR